MNKIRNEIKLLKDNIQRVNDDKYSDIFTNISDILDRLSDKVEDLMVNQKVIAENINYMNEDISGLQDELFEEVSIDDLEEFEEEYKEINCKNCGKPIFIEESALNNEDINCPYCNSKIVSK